MTKSDIRNGSIVEVRNGIRCIRIDNLFYTLNMSGDSINVDGWNDYLIFSGCHDLDIMKVNNNFTNTTPVIEITQKEKWTWVRKEDILDKEEHDYLEAVIKPFRDKVIWIKKEQLFSIEYLTINFGSASPMFFPDFKTGTMYKGMEAEKEYTLEELGLTK